MVKRFLFALWRFSSGLTLGLFQGIGRGAHGLVRLLWRLVRGLCRGGRFLLRPVVVALLLAVAGTDLWLEWQGVPAGGLEIIQGALLRQGIQVTIGELRVGLVKGVVANRISIFDADAPGEPMAEAQQISLQLSRRDLLSGRIRLRSLRFDRLGVYLPNLPGNPQSLHKRFLGRFTGEARLHRSRLEVANVVGDLAGVRFQIQGEVLDFTPDPQRKPLGVLGWKHLLDRLPADSRDQVEAFMETAFVNGVPQGDGWVDLSFTIPAARPAAAKVSGSLSLSDVTIRDAEFHKIRTRFQFRDGALSLQQFNARLNADQSLNGDLVVDLRRQLLSGEAHGAVRPDVLAYLLRRPLPKAMRDADFTTPIRFKLELQPSPWRDLEKLNARLTLETGFVYFPDFSFESAEVVMEAVPGQSRSGKLDLTGLRIRDVRIDKVKAGLAFDGSQLIVRDLDIRSGSTAGEQLSGTLSYNLRDEMLAGDLSGHLLPGTLASLVPGIPESVQTACGELKAEDKAPAVTCHLDPSPVTRPLEWRGELNVRLEPVRYRDLALQGGSVRAVLEPGAVTAEAEFILAGEPAQSVQGRFKVDLARQRLSGTLDARILADRLLRGLRLEDVATGGLLIHHGAPAVIHLDIADSPLFPLDWNGTGRITAADASYEDLRFLSGSCDLRLEPGRISFLNLSGTTAVGDTLNGNLEVTTRRIEVVIRDCVIRGDPRLVRVFVGRGQSREVFDSIFAGFVWDPANPPVSQIASMLYRDSADGRVWSLLLDAHITAKNATRKELKAEVVDVTLKLNLPDSLTLNPVHVDVGDNHADGSAEFYFTGLPLCRFRLKADGDPRLLLKSLNPDWDKFFDNTRFVGKTSYACDGNFFLLTPEPRPVLRGTLKSEQAWYRQLQVDDFSVRWQMQDTQLAWMPMTGRLFGGAVYSTGAYDFVADSGRLDYNAVRVNLQRLLQALGRVEKPQAIQGLVSANGSLELYRPSEPGAHLALHGDGRVWVRDGDLLNLKLMSNLGTVVGMSNLGKITRFDADLTFAGNQVGVPEFTTDGTVLALRGSGSYSIADGGLEFKVRGTAMDKMRIIPFLLKPFFWMFEADLGGTVDDPKWRVNSKLKSFFSSSDPPGK